LTASRYVPRNAPGNDPSSANAPISGTPAGNPPTAIAPPGNVPVNYALPNNPPPNHPPENAPPAAAPPVAGPPEAPLDYGKPLPGTRIIARVGTEFVLEADVLGYANDMINRNKARIPKDQIDKVREELMKQRLDQLIQTKVILADCRSSVPADGFKKFAEKIGQHFDDEEVPK